jgi:metal-sulfur cluster biosynthetic enzyme
MRRAFLEYIFGSFKKFKMSEDKIMTELKELPTEQEITNVLMAVEDPELHINIVDLGLIYKIDRDTTVGKVTVPHVPMALNY